MSIDYWMIDQQVCPVTGSCDQNALSWHGVSSIKPTMRGRAAQERNETLLLISQIHISTVCIPGGLLRGRLLLYGVHHNDWHHIQTLSSVVNDGEIFTSRKREISTRGVNRVAKFRLSDVCITVTWAISRHHHHHHHVKFV